MLNEFRQDLVSGDWILFSTGLAKKPVDQEVKQKFYQSKDSCPFENPQPAQGEPVLAYLNGKKLEWEGNFSGDWTTQVIKNKYPVLKNGICTSPRDEGPFKVFDAYGYHELVITREHDLSFSEFTTDQTAEIITAYKERYVSISKEGCGDFVSIFHNHGRKAGASKYHNHSQILSTPVIPPEVLASVKGAERYYRQNNKKVHDVLINWAVKEKKPVICENERFISFCPFASKTPYEIRIFPKQSTPRFEEISDEDIILLADILNTIMKKIALVLDKPDYNFYIHTAPVLKDPGVDYGYYHWHFEIVPRLSIAGGFELGTNVYINSVDPNEAAEKLRNAKI